MSKLLFVPFIVTTMIAMLVWAMARHGEIARAQRAAAALRPRGRPYATTMPECLRRR